jgi:TorA maturation chaperone TorD
MKGISENETGGMNILVDAGMLDKKKKKNAEDDFSTADMMLSLLAATSKQAEDSLGLKTEADKLSYKLQMLTNLITEREKQPKGFFKNFYVPMLAEMKEKNYMQTACYIAMTSSRDEAIKKWLAENESRINELYEWFDAYTWTKKE